MQKEVEEEDFWDNEINVEDALKAIFKPDYEKTKDLERTTIYVSAEWTHIVRLLKKRLRIIGATRQGIHFIRRRLTIYGLQLLHEENKETINKRQEEYDNNLETYNPLTTIIAAQLLNIYPRESIRTSLYLKEETMGWVHDISDMFGLNTYSVIRAAWGHTILKLVTTEHLPEGFREHATQDIDFFMQYVLRKW